MNTSAVLDIGLQALLVAGKLAAPILITALVVGFTVSLLQSITQVQEVTLSSFTHSMFERIPSLLGG